MSKILHLHQSFQVTMHVKNKHPCVAVSVHVKTPLCWQFGVNVLFRCFVLCNTRDVCLCRFVVTESSRMQLCCLEQMVYDNNASVVYLVTSQSS